jgi:hypothetical protein
MQPVKTEAKINIESKIFMGFLFAWMDFSLPSNTLDAIR